MSEREELERLESGEAMKRIIEHFKSDPSPITNSELRKKLDIPKGTLSENITRLREWGLITSPKNEPYTWYTYQPLEEAVKKVLSSHSIPPKPLPPDRDRVVSKEDLIAEVREKFYEKDTEPPKDRKIDTFIRSELKKGSYGIKLKDG